MAPLPKLSKSVAMYLEKGPPPFLDRYECRTCPLFQPDLLECKIVEGEIKPCAWCAFWIPMRTPFIWIFEKPTSCA